MCSASKLALGSSLDNQVGQLVLFFQGSKNDDFRLQECEFFPRKGGFLMIPAVNFECWKGAATVFFPGGDHLEMQPACMFFYGHPAESSLDSHADLRAACFVLSRLQ